MRFSGNPRRIWREAWRRTLVCGYLLAFVAASVGIPLPRVFSNGGLPFPCQGHSCGCHNAVECWRHCCCYSPEEKLAWAKAHGVNPPAFFLAEIDPAEHEEHGGTETHAEHAAHSDHVANAGDEHCAGRQPQAPPQRHEDATPAAPRACCRARLAAKAASQAVASGSANAATKAKAAAAEQSEGFWEFAIGANYAKCRGDHSNWYSCDVGPAPPVVDYRVEWLVVERFSHDSSPAVVSYLPPPTPPPPEV